MATKNLLTTEFRIPVNKLPRKLLNLVTAKSLAENVPPDRALTMLLNELAAARKKAPATKQVGPGKQPATAS